MKVLVTGASGLLGRTVATALIDRGHPVRVFQRTPSGLPCEERLGDVTDPGAVSDAVIGVDGVVHLAARVTPLGSWPDFHAVNVGGTAALLDAARAAGVDRFVQVSSPSVAHAGRALVGAGAAPADPSRCRGHYSRSKAEAELTALAASSETFAVVAVRPHLVWGPEDTQLVGRIVERARSGRLALIGQGAALVDSTYVTNAADAIVAALERADLNRGAAFVISNGEPRTVRELLERICAAAGVPPPARRLPVRLARPLGALVELAWEHAPLAGEPPLTRFLAEQLATAHWFDQRLTRERLGWEPRVPLHEGFERLAAWYDAGAPTVGPALAAN